MSYIYILHSSFLNTSRLPISFFRSSYSSNHICLHVSLFFIAAIFSYFQLNIPSYLSHLEKCSMLDVTFQGGCILPADDPLWNQSAHCQGAYGHGFRSYVLEWRIYRYARLPSLFIIVVTNKKDHRDRCPQDVQPNQPKTKKSVANTETQCPRSQSGHAM